MPAILTRHRTLVSHPTPTLQLITEELTLLNPGPHPLTRIDVAFDVVPVALRASLDDGRQLAIAQTNRQARIWTVYLSPDEALPRGKHCLIRLEYPGTPVAQRVTHWRSLLFNYYVYRLRFDRVLHGPVPDRIIIEPPPELELGEPDPKPDPKNPDPYLLAASGMIVLRRARNRPFTIEYPVTSDYEHELFVMLFVFSMLGISTTLLLLSILELHDPGVLGDASSIVKPIIEAVGTPVILASAAYIGLATNPITHRTKLWVLLAVGLTIAALFIGAI